MIPNVTIKPTLEEIQEALISAGKFITSVSKGVGQWTGGKVQAAPDRVNFSFFNYFRNAFVNLPTLIFYSQKRSWKKLAGQQNLDLKSKMKECDSSKVETPKERRRRLYKFHSEEKSPFPTQEKNFYNHVMENKEVVKTLSLLSTCIQDIKKEMNTFMARWNPYKILWTNDHSNRKDLLTMTLQNFESLLQKYGELESNLSIEDDLFYLGSCLVVSTGILIFIINFSWVIN